jgi:hypothetical protein
MQYKWPSKQAIKEEILYIVGTTIVFVGIDGFSQVLRLHQGDISRDALLSFGTIILRSVVKSLLIQVFPKLGAKGGSDISSPAEEKTP